MNKFCDRLREERNRLGLNQSDFAELGGVKLNAQVNYENGSRKPDSGYLAAISNAGVDVLYVLTGTRTDSLAKEMNKEEQALLDNYRHADEGGKAVARKVLDALAKPDDGGKKSA